MVYGKPIRMETCCCSFNRTLLANNKVASKSFIKSLHESFCAYGVILEICEESDWISWATNHISRNGDVQVSC